MAGATGKAGDVVKLPTRGATTAPLLVAVGLGKPGPLGAGNKPATVDDDPPSAEQVRRASGAAARALAGTARAASTLSRLDLAAAAEGTLLGAYTFTAYRSGNGSRRDPLGSMVLLSTDPEAEATLRTATAVAEAVSTARDLVNTPPNDLFPESFAARAAELAAEVGVEVEVLDDAALAAGELRRRARGRTGHRPASHGWCGCAGRVGPPRGPRSRWSARASPSTPAGSRSSPRPTWTT